MNDNEWETLIGQALGRWRKNYIFHRGQVPSEVTLSNKRRSLMVMRRNARTVFSRDDIELTEVLQDRGMILDMKTFLMDTVSAGTHRNYMQAMRDLEAFLVERGDLAGPTIEGGDFPSKTTPPPIVIYTDDELKRLLAASWMGGYRWAALVHLLAGTGRRISELLNLRWDELTNDREGFYFTLDRTKNGDQQYVPVPEDFASEFLAGDGYEEFRGDTCFTSANYQKPLDAFLFPWHYCSARDRFARMCERTKVQARGFHNFRHTVITNRIAAGVPLQAVAALAGHRDPRLTATRYNHSTALSYRQYLRQPQD